MLLGLCERADFYRKHRKKKNKKKKKKKQKKQKKPAKKRHIDIKTQRANKNIKIVNKKE